MSDPLDLHPVDAISNLPLPLPLTAIHHSMHTHAHTHGINIEQQQQQQQHQQQQHTYQPSSNDSPNPNGVRPLLSSNAVQLAAAAAAATSSSINNMHQHQQMTNTSRNTDPVPEIKVHPAVRIFENWHRSHPHYGSSFQPLSHLPIATFLVVLGDWIMTAQKAHGGAYTADTLYVYLSSMQRHIRVTHRLPSFNLLDSDTVKVVMDKKFGPNTLEKLMNPRFEEYGEGGYKANKRKRGGAITGMVPAGVGSNAAPYMLNGMAKAPQLFGLPSGDMLAFKPPKPSHSHRSFHTEARLLTARQDPSTPEGLLRCLLWIMLTHIPSMSKTACWNLTMNQFSVLTMPHNPDEKKDGPDGSVSQLGSGLRYLQYTPVRRAGPGHRASEQSAPIVMYEQPSLLHCCPVYLFTEFQKHRPDLNGDGAPKQADVGPPTSTQDDTSHLWLLTKKVIDVIGDHGGQSMWYANRRIGQGTMEKLIAIVKNSRNQPAPTHGDAIAERAAKLAADEEDGDDDLDDDVDIDGVESNAGGSQLRQFHSGDGSYDGSGDDEDSASKRPRVKRDAAAAAQASIAFGNFAGLGSQLTPSLYPWQKQVRGAKKETPQQRMAKQIYSRAGANIFGFGIPPILPSMAANGAAAAAQAAAAAAAGVAQYMPIPPHLSTIELRTYMAHFAESIRQVKNTVEVMERGLADLTEQLNKSTQDQHQQQHQHQQQQDQTETSSTSNNAMTMQD